MTDTPNELERRAAADGATFLRSPAGTWAAYGKDGVIVVFGALSRAEAARLYCEDREISAPAAGPSWLATLLGRR
jgi:hypothetical protein